MMINLIKSTHKVFSAFKFKIQNKSSTIFINQSNLIIKSNLNKYFFSRTELIRNLEIYLQKLNRQESLNNIKQIKVDQNQQKRKQTQQKILKNFLQLTQESFCQNLLRQDSKNFDPSVILMICSTMQNSEIVAKILPKVYHNLNIFDKSELLLFFQLILSHKIKQKPTLPNSMPLQNIQTILVILNQLYPASNLLDWIKQIPLYKGQNVYPLQLGLYSIIQKLDAALIYRNAKLIKKCYQRIKNLLIDQEDQLKVSSIILALDSKSTAAFGQQLAIDLQIDLTKIDPYKLQLLLIATQKHVFNTYSHLKTGNQIKKKKKFQIIQEDQENLQGQEEEEQQKLAVLQKGYQHLNEEEKVIKLQNMLKTIMKNLIQFDWLQIVKLNMLIEYWKLFQTFQDKQMWNKFRSRVIKHTQDPKIFKSLMSLTNNEILDIMTALQKRRLNKPELLKKLLIILSERLSTIQKQNLIKLSRVLVTYVRQCESYLIQVRRMIEQRLFIFSKQDIQELNEIFRRVQVLFPRPLVK